MSGFSPATRMIGEILRRLWAWVRSESIEVERRLLDLIERGPAPRP